VTNWEALVKLPKVLQIDLTETCTKLLGEPLGQLGQYPLPIGGTGLPGLLKFHNVAANVPIGFDHMGVNGAVTSLARLQQNAAHLGEQAFGFA
jgi:hypothetical protein